MLEEIRRLTRFASKYETAFVDAVMGQSRQALEQAQQLRKKELCKLHARDRELDVLFERMYEDNVSGKISDERFKRMTARYEDEQAELQQKIKALEKELAQSSDSAMTTDTFIATVRRYTRAKKLTTRMLNELIHHIEVHQAEKVNGVQVQRLTIHYNCVGTIAIPDIPPLTQPDVTMQTRKGVAVRYAPVQSAV